MNLLLHGVTGKTDEELPITCADSLQAPSLIKANVVITNPPFGVKGSVTYSAEERPNPKNTDALTIVRSDFWVETANKQLNFLQHIYGLLKPGGRAAVVVPDNVLFEGGAAAAIRRRLLEFLDVHTLLRLPAGLFYAQGVKANVLFFDRPIPSLASNAVSRHLWVYDLRSDNRFSLKTRPIRAEDLAEFVKLYRSGRLSERQHEETKNGAIPRWRAFATKDILSTEQCSLDLLRETEVVASRKSGLVRLDEISQLVADDLTRALAQIALVRAKR